MRRKRYIGYSIMMLCTHLFVSACGTSMPSNTVSDKAQDGVTSTPTSDAEESRQSAPAEDESNVVSEEGEVQNNADEEDAEEDAAIEFEITSNVGKYFDMGFSEGLAWVQYYDDAQGYGFGILNESGELVLAADEEGWNAYLGANPIYHNFPFQDGISCVYGDDSYLIVDKEGRILTYAISTESCKYHLLGYGYGEFLIWKEVVDIERRSSDYVYLIDTSGDVVSEILIDGGSMNNHQFTCLEKGVFTDDLHFCDMNRGDWIKLTGPLSSDLAHWDGRVGCTCIECWIYDQYPMARVYAYYGERRGFILNDFVYQVDVLDDIYKEWNYVFYDIDGNVIGEVFSDAIPGLKLDKIGLYSNGYVPVQLKDAEQNVYVTIIDMNGNPLFAPAAVDCLNINDASYDGYFSVRAHSNEDDVKVITPTGEVKRIGDDVSGIGRDARLYVQSGAGSFLSGGYWFDMNCDAERLYSADGQLMTNVYVSIDGKQVIDKVKLTSRTKWLPQSDMAIKEDHTLKLELFQGSPEVYHGELAKIAAMMSEKSEDMSPSNIEELYRLYNIENVKSYNYEDTVFGGGACSIGTYSEGDAKVLVITCRGSKTIAEFVGDWQKGWIGDKTRSFLGQEVYTNDYDFYVKLIDAIDDYTQMYPNLKTEQKLKIFINGHSLGGAAASMLGAKIDADILDGTFFNSNVKKSDVFVYTFGAIKVLNAESNISAGYENIHNIYNYYDAYGPHGNKALANASASGAKFGHTDLFYLDVEENALSDKNHWMSIYRDALEMEDITKGFIVQEYE